LKISYRLARTEEAADTPDEEKTFRILQRIIPDLVINGRSLYGEGPLAGAKSIVDVKTLSPCGSPDERTGNPNAVVDTRQKKVNADYHAKAKSLDARGGDMHGGFDAELNSYGQAGRVIGPVVGAFGEMPSDVHVIAKAVAEELALEHCSFYGDKTLKVVKVFFSQPALPILGTHGPPRMGAPSTRPPVPCAGSQCALPSFPCR
jgi:hypothetical protein